MTTTTATHDRAVETFVDCSQMSEAEAEVYVRVELGGRHHSEVARELDKSEQTVMNQLSQARKKARLPEVSQLDRHHERVPDRGLGYSIWFGNGAKLRYEYDREREEIVQETFYAGDPDSVYYEVGVGGDEDEVEEYALDALEMYINDYRDNPDACRKDWEPVYEAITGYT